MQITELPETDPLKGVTYGLRALFECHELVKVGKLPAEALYDLVATLQSVAHLFFQTYGVNSKGSELKGETVDRRAKQYAALIRIVMADEYELPTKKLEKIAEEDDRPALKQHGERLLKKVSEVIFSGTLETEVFNKLYGVRRLLEYKIFGVQAHLSKDEADALIKAIRQPAKLAHSSSQETQDLKQFWKPGKVNSIQSLAIAAYRDECKWEGIDVPNTANLKLHLQSYIKELVIR